MSIDREALGEAADRGLLAAYWAARQPDRIALYSEVGNRTFADIDENANRRCKRLATSNANSWRSRISASLSSL